MNDDFARGDLEVCALARQIVGALAGDLDRRIRRRRLLDNARSAAAPRISLGGAALSLAPTALPSASSVSVSSPHLHRETIGLGAFLHDRHGLGRFAECDRQDARSERIQGARVANLLGVKEELELRRPPGLTSRRRACRDRSNR